RAGDDARLTLGALAVDPRGDGLKPWLPVFVGEGDAGVHLRDIGLRMQPVALLERPSQTRRERLRYRAFPRARHAHDDQDRRAAMMSMRTLQAMNAGGVGEENQCGPADE